VALPGSSGAGAGGICDSNPLYDSRRADGGCHVRNLSSQPVRRNWFHLPRLVNGTPCTWNSAGRSADGSTTPERRVSSTAPAVRLCSRPALTQTTDDVSRTFAQRHRPVSSRPPRLLTNGRTARDAARQSQRHARRWAPDPPSPRMDGHSCPGNRPAGASKTKAAKRRCEQPETVPSPLLADLRNRATGKPTLSQPRWMAAARPA